VWGVFVNLPQLLLNESSHDISRDINATITSLPIAATEAPSLVYFGGYQPAYYKQSADEVGYGEEDPVYPMDVFYFLSATLGTVGVSLIWLVLAISAMLRQRQGSSKGSEEANAVQEIVELVFNGWDMLETTSFATANMRAHIRVHLEHKHEQLRRAADTRQAKSAKQVRDLFVKRGFCVTLSGLLLVGSIAVVVLTLDPRLFRGDVEKWGARISKSDAFGEILPSLIVTMVNTIAPMIIKVSPTRTRTPHLARARPLPLPPPPTSPGNRALRELCQPRARASSADRSNLPDQDAQPRLHRLHPRLRLAHRARQDRG